MKADGCFQIGDRFPASQQCAELFRLVVADRHLLALMRLAGSNGPRDPAERENWQQWFSVTVHAAKEAADASRAAYADGWFDVQSRGSGADWRQMLADVIRESNKDDSTSLYCRTRKPIRDQLGGHWHVKSIETALKQLKDVELEQLYYASQEAQMTTVGIN